MILFLFGGGVFIQALLKMFEFLIYFKVFLLKLQRENGPNPPTQAPVKYAGKALQFEIISKQKATYSFSPLTHHFQVPF